MKWVDYDRMSSGPVTDLRLARRLQDESARLFVALKGAGFGRCDIRVDRDGTPWMLEINANCGIYFPPDGFGGADMCLPRTRKATSGSPAAWSKPAVAAPAARARGAAVAPGTHRPGEFRVVHREFDSAAARCYHHAIAFSYGADRIGPGPRRHPPTFRSP